MIRIIICDDDVGFASQLKNEIEKAMNGRRLRVRTQVFCSAEEIGSESILTCDIAFLDIDFKGKDYNGIDIARKLRSRGQDTIIVFVTNYIEYAPAGYEVQAFRYILKDEVDRKLETYMEQILAQLQTAKSDIKIQTDGEFIDILTQEITYIESMGHTLNIHVRQTRNSVEKIYNCYSSLSKMEADLEKRGFLRIHKSYLANMRHIKKLSCSEVLLSDETVLRVGRKNYAECKRKFLLWRGQQ